MRTGNAIIAASIGIMLWVLICSVGWFVATRGDYAKLAAASACYSAQLQSNAPDCANVQASDAETYKAAIDRKARISRLAGSFGAVVAIALLIASRGRRRRPQG